MLVEERQQRIVSAYAPQHTVQICLLGHRGPPPPILRSFEAAHLDGAEWGRHQR